MANNSDKVEPTETIAVANATGTTTFLQRSSTSTSPTTGKFNLFKIVIISKYIRYMF